MITSLVRYAHADERPFQISLYSTDGTAIQIEYIAQHKVEHYSEAWIADPLSIHAYLPEGFDCNVPIRAVLLNYSETVSTPLDRTERDAIRIADLRFMDRSTNRCHFAASIDPIEIHRTGIQGVKHYRQEIAVVVNGLWLEDPVGKRSNFNFNLYLATDRHY